MAAGNFRSALTRQEKSTLSACEADIERGAEMVSKAIALIRSRKLYRGEYGTFEAYMQDRWNSNRLKGIRMADHGQVLLNLKGENVPNRNISERAASEISDLPAPEQAEVVTEAAKSGPPTQRKIQEARRKLAGSGKISGGTSFDVEEIETAGGQEEPADSQEENAVVLDVLGRVIPERCLPAAMGAIRIGECIKAATSLRKMLNGLKGSPEAMNLDTQGLTELLTRIQQECKAAAFWTTCPRCCNPESADCNLCGGKGWISKSGKGYLREDELREIEAVPRCN